MAKKNHINHFHHANLYYITMTVAFIYMIFCLVQGIVYHLELEITFALLFYTQSVLSFIIAVSSYKRGKGHYHYHGHLE